uniref:NADH-ubiquinone oxidoreductase chain 4L n=1 Tax=Micropterix calthella TaxID=41027 RepID=A0A076E9U0_9NEOP|nr:NADH dehydrogenase subunit 4L [Micropterix calthella]
MIMFNYLYSLIMFFIGNYLFIFNRKNMLYMLLILEFLMLSLYLLLFFLLLFLNMEMYFLLLFLIFSVCESVLGMSILIYLVRMHGNDYLLLLNLY